jgi:hypothetical protein
MNGPRLRRFQIVEPHISLVMVYEYFMAGFFLVVTVLKPSSGISGA